MFSFPETARFLETTVHFPVPGMSFDGASIDTRTLKEGQIFVALPGENQDGHLYLSEAFAKGASGAIISHSYFRTAASQMAERPDVYKNLMPVRAPDEALARLAAWHRGRMSAAAIGITGSAGKTTTKEFLAYLLSRRHPVLANRGNFNNHLGLPLTLMQLREEHRFCVAELGANHRGDIRFLASVLRPDAGVITQICPAHLEGFGSMEAIYETKLELFEALRPGSWAVVPDHDEVLLGKARRLNLRFIRVGTSKKSDCRISDIAVREGEVCFKVNNKYPFSFPGIASFYASNAALAVAAAEVLGIAMRDMPERWSDLSLPAGRFTPVEIGDVRVIDDGYNANPRSFEKALDSFSEIETAGRKILVFADMAELGADEDRYHEELGRRIAEHDFDFVAAYGRRAARALEALKSEAGAENAAHFPGPGEAVSFLDSFLRPGDWVLAKASRSMRIEEVIAGLRRAREARQVAAG